MGNYRWPLSELHLETGVRAYYAKASDCTCMSLTMLGSYHGPHVSPCQGICKGSAARKNTDTHTQTYTTFCRNRPYTDKVAWALQWACMQGGCSRLLSKVAWRFKESVEQFLPRIGRSTGTRAVILTSLSSVVEKIPTQSWSPEIMLATCRVPTDASCQTWTDGMNLVLATAVSKYLWVLCNLLQKSNVKEMKFARGKSYTCARSIRRSLKNSTSALNGVRKLIDYKYMHKMWNLIAKESGYSSSANSGRWN